MIYNLYFTLLSIFLFNTVNAQQQLFRKTILDSKTKLAIPYATIHLSNTTKSIDADEKGYFEINTNLLDSIEFSSIGYNTLKIPIFEMNKSENILLQTKPITMESIIVKKLEKKTFGNINSKINTSSTGSGADVRQEFATLIEVLNGVKTYRISKVFIKGRKFKPENPIRLHIYELDSNGLPGKELMLKERILSNNEVEGKMITVDIKDQNIILEKPSFFISIQWITSNKVKIFTGPEIYETYSKEKMLTLRRQQNLKSNNWFASWKNNMMVFLPSKDLPIGDIAVNNLVSAEVEIIE
jgi:CarboxypepD_reg-like domain